MIPRRSISLISNSLMSAGGRRIPEAVIERDYVLAWLLSGLAAHPLFQQVRERDRPHLFRQREACLPRVHDIQLTEF